MEWSGTFRQEKRIIFFVPYLTRPHVCRHTYCSNMAKTGINPKSLQYLMGHADISVTLNTYTHVRFEDAKEELQKLKLVKPSVLGSFKGFHPWQTNCGKTS